METKPFFLTADAMKKPMNLHEEIAAMAKSDSTGASAISMENVRIKEEERQNSSAVKSNSNETPRKRKKNRAQLVQEIRISVSFTKFLHIAFLCGYKIIGNICPI